MVEKGTKSSRVMLLMAAGSVLAIATSYLIYKLYQTSPSSKRTKGLSKSQQQSPYYNMIDQSSPNREVEARRWMEWYVKTSFKKTKTKPADTKH